MYHKVAFFLNLQKLSKGCFVKKDNLESAFLRKKLKVYVEKYLVQNNELSFETYQFWTCIFSVSIFSDLANFEAYNKKIFKKAKNVILSILILLICCDLANLRDFI